MNFLYKQDSALITWWGTPPSKYVRMWTQRVIASRPKQNGNMPAKQELPGSGMEILIKSHGIKIIPKAAPHLWGRSNLIPGDPTICWEMCGSGAQTSTMKLRMAPIACSGVAAGTMRQGDVWLPTGGVAILLPLGLMT